MVKTKQMTLNGKDAETSICSDCLEQKLLKEFDVDRYQPTKIRRKRFCHKCRSKRDQQTKKAHMLRDFPKPDACPICERKVDFVLDHNHETGNPCSFLCNICNQQVGRYRNPHILKNLVAYVFKHHPTMEVSLLDFVAQLQNFEH